MAHGPPIMTVERAAAIAAAAARVAAFAASPRGIRERGMRTGELFTPALVGRTIRLYWDGHHPEARARLASFRQRGRQPSEFQVRFEAGRGTHWLDLRRFAWRFEEEFDHQRPVSFGSHGFADLHRARENAARAANNSGLDEWLAWDEQRLDWRLRCRWGWSRVANTGGRLGMQA